MIIAAPHNCPDEDHLDFVARWIFPRQLCTAVNFFGFQVELPFSANAAGGFSPEFLPLIVWAEGVRHSSLEHNGWSVRLLSIDHSSPPQNAGSSRATRQSAMSTCGQLFDVCARESGGWHAICSFDKTFQVRRPPHSRCFTLLSTRESRRANLIEGFA